MRLPAACCLVVLAATATLACDGGDAESDGDTEAFCAALADADARIGDDADTDTISDAFRQMDESAPSEISDATGKLVEFASRGAEISELPQDEQQAAIDEFATLESEFTAASADIEDYARENCSDLGDDFFGTS